ncbi:MAG: pectate lyase [Spirochaetes bacterium]|nr:pectate lyase [Spirochaetota bacterium]
MKNIIFTMIALLSTIVAVLLFISAKTSKPLFNADGYASMNGGTIGGSKAFKRNIFTVTNKSELLKALYDAKGELSNDPKIIYISGVIDLCVDENNKPLTEKDFAAAPYTLEKYLETYSPEKWGRKNVTGELETARKESERNQAKTIVIKVGSNTTLIGKDKDAKIIHGNLLLEKVSNIIIKNITFEDAYDFFPEWDPSDGPNGNWNSQFDLIAIANSTNVWIDHCTFSDGDRPDSTLPVYFNMKYQTHDGAVDITRQSNYITLSYNYFFDHDKTTLVGSSDNSTSDKGNLKVTFHHNYYEKINQRMPRVRFGEVHVYNNYYNNIGIYAIGIGREASIYAEANFFENIKGPATQIKYYDTKGAGYIKDVKNVPPIEGIISSSDGIHTGKVNWNPKSRYQYKVDNTNDVKNICITYSGAGKPERY